MLHIDFETRSRTNLVTRGVYNYAQDPSTEVACMGYAFDDEPPKMWSNLLHRQPFPDEVREYIASGGMIVAHNAAFERLMFWYVVCPDFDVPEPAIEQFYCTAVQCRFNAYPGKLEDACKALNTAYKKDMTGHRLMMKLCRPNAFGNFYEDPEDLRRQEEYCISDVLTERAIHHSLRDYTEKELQQYHTSEHINDYGVKIDLDFAKAASTYADDEVAEIKQELERLTDGEIKTPRQFARIKKWLIEPYTDDQGKERVRLPDDAIALSEYYDQGKKKNTFDKDVRHNLLNYISEHPGCVDEKTYSVIQLIDDAGRSSVSKYVAMQRRVDVETRRVHGAYIFCGAGQTGRYSAFGLQIHNFARDCYKENIADEISKVLVAEDALLQVDDDSVMDTLAKMLRPTLIADDGYSLVVGDWSAIEARALPWLANDPDAEEILNVFRNKGDVYIREASRIFRLDDRSIAKDSYERQVGKVAILSLGYGGGVGAFKQMAKGYRLSITDSESERIKTAWRESNPWAERFWGHLRRAAFNAVRNIGQPFQAGRVSYLATTTGDHYTLWCLLPTGRLLSYPRVAIEAITNKWGSEQLVLTALKANWKPKKDETQWPRITLWHGILAENITQAICADILREKLSQIHLDGKYNIAMHVHDEIVLEVPDCEAHRATKYLTNTMIDVPEWAEGLPLDAEIWNGKRYRK